MNFIKMHSLGNSFIILEEKNISSEKNINELAKKLCDPHTGIGADGILVVLPSTKADIKMRIINADGSEAEMCGNGIRCLAKYVFENNIVKKTLDSRLQWNDGLRLQIETISGIIESKLNLDNEKISSIKINMGPPSFDKIIDYPINIAGSKYRITHVILGVPHTIIFTDNIDEQAIKKIAPLIEKHELFPEKTNVDFVKIINKNEIEIKTWERGVGITKACGTGASASAIACNINNKTEKNITVKFELGNLFVEWQDNDNIYMTGPDAENIREGEFYD